MNFERGQDIKTVLGLGKFHELDTDMNKFINGIYSGKNWKPDIKLMTDSKGSNLHRFLIWIEPIVGRDLEEIRSQLKKYIYHIDSAIICKSGNFKFVVMNSYRSSKYLKKYDFHKGETGLFIEIIFNEKMNKKPKRSSFKHVTWSI